MRDSVLQTLKMSDSQRKDWVEAAGAAADKERRQATFFRDGHAETIERGPDGKLRYTIRDAAGVRSSQDRQSVLDTLKMTPAQLKTWANAAAGKAQGRAVDAENRGFGQVTIRNAQGSVSSSNGASARKAMKLSADDIRAWVKDDTDGKEHTQVIPVFVAPAKKLAQEHVVYVEQVDVQPAEGVQGACALPPSPGKIVRLHVTEVQPKAILQRLHQGMIVANLLGHLADHVDVVRVTHEVTGDD